MKTLNEQELVHVDLWNLPTDEKLKILSVSPLMNDGGIQLMVGSDENRNKYYFVNIPLKDAEIYFVLDIDKTNGLSITNWTLNNYHKPDKFTDTWVYIDDYFYEALKQSKITIDYLEYITEEILMQANAWKNMEYSRWFDSMSISSYCNKYDFKFFEIFSKIKNFWLSFDLNKLEKGSHKGSNEEFEHFFSHIDKIRKMDDRQTYFKEYQESLEVKIS